MSNDKEDAKKLAKMWEGAVTAQVSYLYDDEEITHDQAKEVITAVEDVLEKTGVKKAHIDLRQNRTPGL